MILKVHVASWSSLVGHTLPPALLQYGPVRACSMFVLISQAIADTVVMHPCT